MATPLNQGAARTFAFGVGSRNGRGGFWIVGRWWSSLLLGTLTFAGACVGRTVGIGAVVFGAVIETCWSFGTVM